MMKLGGAESVCRRSAHLLQTLWQVLLVSFSFPAFSLIGTRIGLGIGLGQPRPVPRPVLDSTVSVTTGLETGVTGLETGVIGIETNDFPPTGAYRQLLAHRGSCWTDRKGSGQVNGILIYPFTVLTWVCIHTKIDTSVVAPAFRQKIISEATETCYLKLT